MKTQQHSIAETVKIVQRADDHLDFWMKTWAEWAREFLSVVLSNALMLKLTLRFTTQVSRKSRQGRT